MEGTNLKQLPIVTTIDFKKAFDSINRNAMWKILRHYGIPNKIVTAISCVYKDSKSRVRIGDKLSDEFKITSGILQGDSLAPFLFTIVMDYIISKCSTDTGFTTHQNPDTKINHLAFADDIVLIDESAKEAIKHIKSLSKEASKVGLSLNIEKTKYMTNIKNDEKNFKKFPNIEKVQEFKYLGSQIESSEADLQKRRQKAWTVFWEMKKVWSSKEINLHLKLRIYQATCLSIFMYGSETWIITKKMENTINAFGTSCYRYILQKSKRDRIRNEDILNKVGKENLINDVRRRQLKFIGKNLRTQNTTKKYTLYEPELGKQKQGRPKLTFRKYIEKITDRSSEELETISEEDKWLIEIVGDT